MCASLIPKPLSLSIDPEREKTSIAASSTDPPRKELLLSADHTLILTITSQQMSLATKSIDACPAAEQLLARCQAAPGTSRYHDFCRNPSPRRPSLGRFYEEIRSVCPRKVRSHRSHNDVYVGKTRASPSGVNEIGKADRCWQACGPAVHVGLALRASIR